MKDIVDFSVVDMLYSEDPDSSLQHILAMLIDCSCSHGVRRLMYALGYLQSDKPRDILEENADKGDGWQYSDGSEAPKA